MPAGTLSLRKHRALRPNLSIDTDPQQQAAALPLVLVVRSFLRYASLLSKTAELGACCVKR